MKSWTTERATQHAADRLDQLEHVREHFVIVERIGSRLIAKSRRPRRAAAQMQRRLDRIGERRSQRRP